MASLYERLLKLLPEENANNILDTSPDDEIVDFPTSTPPAEPDFSGFKPILDNIPAAGNSFLTQNQKDTMERQLQERLGHPEPHPSNPLASKQFSLLSSNLPYNELNKEDQSVIDSSVDDALQQDPTLLNYPQDLGTPERAQQSLARYVNLFPGAEPAPRIDNQSPGQVSPAGAPGSMAAMHQTDQANIASQILPAGAPGSLASQAAPYSPPMKSPIPGKVPTTIAEAKEPIAPPPTDQEVLDSFQPGGETDSIASLENLLAAQNAANNVRTSSNVLRGLDLASAGIAGLGSNSQVKPSGQQLFKDQAEGASQITGDYKDQVGMERNDAKSLVSRAMQKYAKKLGFDAKGLSAGDIDKMIPYVSRAFDAQENRAARRENLQARLEEINERDRERKEEKRLIQEKSDRLDMEKSTQDRFDKMGKLVAAEVASGRSSFGRMGNNIRSAEAIERLVQGRPLKDLDNREIYEVAKSLDALLSQGQSTISGTAHLIPHTARGDLAKLQEFLTNKRMGVGGDSFLKQMLKTVGREKELAAEQIQKVQRKLLAPYKDLKEKDNDKWITIMKQHDLPENPFDESTDQQPKMSSGRSKFYNN